MRRNTQNTAAQPPQLSIDEMRSIAASLLFNYASQPPDKLTADIFKTIDLLLGGNKPSLSETTKTIEANLNGAKASARREYIDSLVHQSISTPEQLFKKIDTSGKGSPEPTQVKSPKPNTDQASTSHPQPPAGQHSELAQSGEDKGEMHGSSATTTYTFRLLSKPANVGDIKEHETGYFYHVGSSTLHFRQQAGGELEERDIAAPENFGKIVPTFLENVKEASAALHQDKPEGTYVLTKAEVVTLITRRGTNHLPDPSGDVVFGPINKELLLNIRRALRITQAVIVTGYADPSKYAQLLKQIEELKNKKPGECPGIYTAHIMELVNVIRGTVKFPSDFDPLFNDHLRMMENEAWIAFQKMLTKDAKVLIDAIDIDLKSYNDQTPSDQLIDTTNLNRVWNTLTKEIEDEEAKQRDVMNKVRISVVSQEGEKAQKISQAILEPPRVDEDKEDKDKEDKESGNDQKDGDAPEQSGGEASALRQQSGSTSESMPQRLSSSTNSSHSIHHDDTKKLLSDPLSVNIQDGAGDTMLHCALAHTPPNWPLIARLLQRGARLDIKNTKGKTPLDLPNSKCLFEFQDTADFFRKKGISDEFLGHCRSHDALHFSGNNVFHWIIKHHQLDSLAAFYKFAKGKNKLHQLFQQENTEKCTPLEVADNDGHTALHLSVDGVLGNDEELHVELVGELMTMSQNTQYFRKKIPHVHGEFSVLNGDGQHLDVKDDEKDEDLSRRKINFLDTPAPTPTSALVPASVSLQPIITPVTPSASAEQKSKYDPEIVRQTILKQTKPYFALRLRTGDSMLMHAVKKAREEYRLLLIAKRRAEMAERIFSNVVRYIHEELAECLSDTKNPDYINLSDKLTKIEEAMEEIRQGGNVDKIKEQLLMLSAINEHRSAFAWLYQCFGKHPQTWKKINELELDELKKLSEIEVKEDEIKTDKYGLFEPGKGDFGGNPGELHKVVSKLDLLSILVHEKKIRASDPFDEQKHCRDLFEPSQLDESVGNMKYSFSSRPVCASYTPVQLATVLTERIHADRKRYLERVHLVFDTFRVIEGYFLVKMKEYKVGSSDYERYKYRHEKVAGVRKMLIDAPPPSAVDSKSVLHNIQNNLDALKKDPEITKHRNLSWWTRCRPTKSVTENLLNRATEEVDQQIKSIQPIMGNAR